MAKTIPCEICGTSIYRGHKRCDSCWEIVAQLPNFLRTEKGRLIVFKSLLSKDLANAIIDIGCGESLGPKTPERIKAWDKLVSTAQETILSRVREKK